MMSNKANQCPLGSSRSHQKTLTMTIPWDCDVRKLQPQSLAFLLGVPCPLNLQLSAGFGFQVSWSGGTKAQEQSKLPCASFAIFPKIQPAPLLWQTSLWFPNCRESSFCLFAITILLEGRIFRDSYSSGFSDFKSMHTIAFYYFIHCHILISFHWNNNTIPEIVFMIYSWFVFHIFKSQKF